MTPSCFTHSFFWGKLIGRNSVSQKGFIFELLSATKSMFLALGSSRCWAVNSRAPIRATCQVLTVRRPHHVRFIRTGSAASENMVGCLYELKYIKIKKKFLCFLSPIVLNHYHHLNWKIYFVKQINNSWLIPLFNHYLGNAVNAVASKLKISHENQLVWTLSSDKLQLAHNSCKYFQWESGNKSLVWTHLSRHSNRLRFPQVSFP